ncbi:MAG: tyrosine-type recombinase/integrase [Chloroflexi bacterium]|nr:tyrosine-type recombinase/integrase [Chloroflexota bacterium]
MSKTRKIEQALRLVSKLPLSLDVQAFLTDCQARNLSANTIRIYRVNLLAFQKWLRQQDVQDIADLTTGHIRYYLTSLQKSHNPGGVHQAYRVLKTFCRWLHVEGIIESNPMVRVSPPRVPQEPLDPVPMSDVKRMLQTCERRTFTGDRDRAIMLCLLDSGARASEFLSLNVGDVNLGTGAVVVRQGKGRKFRTAFLGSKALRALAQYLRHRPEVMPADPLWIARDGERLTYWGLRQVLERRAHKAGVPIPSPHSFRRAFALTMLRNGCDVMTLQKLMGHSDLSVLRRYLAQTENDLAEAHKRASPVDRLL